MQRDLSAPGSSLFSPPFPHTEDIIHRPWTILVAPCGSCSIQMQLGLGILVGALANSIDSSRRYPTRGSYICTPVTLRRLPSEGRWPRNRQEQPMPCFQCLLPGPAAAANSDWPFQDMPVSSSLHLLFPSDSRLFSELHSELSESLSEVH